MNQPEIAVSRREVYGKPVYYPASFEAEQFAAIAGTKTLTEQVLAGVVALGYRVIVVAGGEPIGSYSPKSGVEYGRAA